MTAKSLLAAVLLALAPLAHALDLAPDTYSVEGGGADGVRNLTLGVGWDWGMQRPLGSMLLTGHTELFAGAWRADAIGGGQRTYGHFGVLPTLRLRFDGGRSPWFAEAGIGLSWLNRTFRTPDKTFSTRFQVTDVIGVGRTFGADGRHELGVRLQHVSNGGIDNPNPGQNAVLLRYVGRF